MLQSLMVPLDGSRFAEQALPLALGAAKRAGADLNLAIVRASFPLDGDRAESYLRSVNEQINSVGPARVTRNVLGNQDAAGRPASVQKSVAEVLERHAKDLACDLIVMTTHGHGGIRRAWMGSVADSLIRVASRPVVVIRPRDEDFTVAASADRGIRHILIPLDGSEQAVRAIAFAQQLGEPFGARYTLVRVTSPMAWHGSPGPTGSLVTVDAPPLSREAVRRYLDSVADGFRQFGVQVAIQALTGTTPAAAILKYARSHDVDVIALTTSGSTGLDRLLLGSVADKIVRSSNVPVLVCNVRNFSESGRTVAAAPAGAVMPRSEQANGER
jgi:nucleotide-binding universal stress UspA family protein